MPYSIDDFHGLHKKGGLALYLNANPELYNDKFDHPCITNNEREDGGSPLGKPNDYQLQLIVSATLLPPLEYKVEQRLYEQGARYFFIGLNIEECRINSFEICDSQTTYNVTNKRNRPSFKATIFKETINHLNYEQRLQYTYKKNNSSALCVTQPTGEESDLFGIQPPDFIRPINEIVLKVNIESVICIGATAAHIANNPAIILDLIYMQHQLFQHLGINYPIIIYNNCKNEAVIDFIDSEPKVFLVNQAEKLNVHHAVIQMLRKYPNGIPRGSFIGTLNNKIGSTMSTENPYSVQEFIKFMQYPLDENKLPILKTPEQLEQELSTRKNEFREKISQADALLDKALIPHESKHIIQSHKSGRNTVAYFEQYLEINQENLRQYIMSTYFNNLGPQPNLSSEYTEYLKILTQAYNLQFRLNMYASFLKDNSLINYSKLEKDLNWCNHLVPIVNDIHDKLFPQNPSISCRLL